MLNIDIKTIAHNRQRYDTCGDYWHSKGVWHFRISSMNNWRWELLIAVHELIEWGLITHAGIKVSAIDRFDREYENNRKKGDDSEPGDDARAPYRVQHLIATGVEKILAALLGVDWNKYNNYVDKL